MLATWQVGEVFWSMMWFSLFCVWIWLLISVFGDIFRGHDLGGFAKGLWVLFVIALPYLGVFIYLIARGNKMSEHAEGDAQAQDEAAQGYIRQAAGPTANPAERTVTPRRREGSRRNRRCRVPPTQGRPDRFDSLLSWRPAPTMEISGGGERHQEGR
jgi:hypothetical protein